MPRDPLELRQMGSRIYIDGYNFLWASDRLRPEALRDFESARNALVERLASSPRLAKHQVCVVFDAHKTDATDGSSESIGGIEVRYTRGGQTADAVIMQAAKESQGSAIVISSDREVARAAEKAGCGVLGSHEFDRLLDQAVWPDIEEDPYAESPKKGPAYRYSKAKRKALARLSK